MLRLVTAPDADTLAVPLDTAKKHLNVDFTDDDTLITAYIGAATTRVEQECRALTVLETTWAEDRDDFCGEIILPRAPVKTVSAVKYFDDAGVQQTLDPDVYDALIDSAGLGQLALAHDAEWPGLRGGDRDVTVQFIAGWTPDKVPPAITAAILLIVGGLYAQRAELSDRTVMRLPDAVDMLLAPYRVWL